MRDGEIIALGPIAQLKSMYGNNYVGTVFFDAVEDAVIEKVIIIWYLYLFTKFRTIFIRSFVFVFICVPIVTKLKVNGIIYLQDELVPYAINQRFVPPVFKIQTI